MTDTKIAIEGRWYAASDCITCGVRYYVPVSVWDHQRAYGGYHHCPAGHSQGWDKNGSEIERIRRERDRLKQDIARADDERREAVAQMQEATTRAAAAETRERKLKRRAAAGTCPCCKRTFSNMNTHMRKIHPEYVAENVVKLRA